MASNGSVATPVTIPSISSVEQVSSVIIATRAATGGFDERNLVCLGEELCGVIESSVLFEAGTEECQSQADAHSEYKSTSSRCRSGSLRPHGLRAPGSLRLLQRR
jgi:hypothetical protein